MKVILYLRNKEKYACIIKLKSFYLLKLTQKSLIDLVFFSLVGKKLPAKAGDLRDTDLIPGLGRSSGVGNGNPLQYSCLGNSMDRGVWQAIVPRVRHNLVTKQHN